MGNAAGRGVLCLAGAMASFASPALILPVWAQADSELLLEAWINDYTNHELVRVRPRPDGSIIANCEDLAAAGMRTVPNTQGCALSANEARIDMTEQRLLITASPDRLLPNVLSAAGMPERASADPSLSGLSLTYDFTTQT